MKRGKRRADEIETGRGQQEARDRIIIKKQGKMTRKEMRRGDEKEGAEQEERKRWPTAMHVKYKIITNHFKI